MTKVYLDPSGTPVSDTGARTGGSTPQGVLSDGSDLTYMTYNPGEKTVFNLEDLTLPSGAVILLAQAAARVARSSGFFNAIMRTVINANDPDASTDSTVSYLTPTGLAGATKWDGTLTDAGLDGATLEIGNSSIALADLIVYEASLMVLYLIKPVVAVAHPTGTLTEDNSPTAIWTTAWDPDYTPSTAKYRVKIFTDAVKTGGGFNPETSTAVLDSGEQELSTSGYQLHDFSDILANGTYWTYVKVSGVEGQWSDWDNEQFIVNVPLPGVPILTTSDDPANGRVVLNLLSRDNLIADRSSHEVAIGTGAFGTGVTATRVSTQAYHGTYSAEIVTPGSTIAGGGEGTNFTATYRAPVTEGEQYYVSQWVKAPLGAQLVFNAGFFSSGGSYLGSGGVNVDFTGTGDWQQVGGLATAPATAAKAGVSVRTRVTPQALTWYEDAHMVEHATAQHPFMTHDAPSTDQFQIQRSEDGGSTWTDVYTSLGDGLVSNPGGTVTCYDYEAPNGVAVKYRARTIHTYASATAYSAWSSSADETWSDPDQWWLKNLTDPDFNLAIRLRDYSDIARPARQVVHEVLGSPFPIVVDDARGATTGTITFRCDDAAEREFVDELLDLTNVTWLLQGPVGHEEKDRWVALGDHSRSRLVPSGTKPWTDEKISWTEVERPT